MTATRLGLLLSAALFGCAGSSSARLHADRLPRLDEQLPVRRVILYQNGIGYFEREGQIDQDAITLHCRHDQINDLLKSLTVIDRGTGRAVSVSLPLDKTGAKVLAELPSQVRHASGLLDVLRVFRGARVRVHGERGGAAGRVVGVEEDVVGTSAAGPVKGWRLTLKTDDGRLVVYPLPQIRDVALADRALELGLDRSLDVSLDSGAWKPVALTARLAGATRHKLLVSYIVEMPNWKPAYRLVIPEASTGRHPLLQGWAVVDNVSGESWRDVRLSLVAGTPMSFIYNLHTPRFTQRVDLTPQGAQTALAPTVEETGHAEQAERSEAQADALAPPAPAATARAESFERELVSRTAKAMSLHRSSRALRQGSGRADDGELAQSLNVELERQGVAEVSGATVAGLFRYDLADPVTIPDNSSTLVNIINARVKGGEVVLYNPDRTGSTGAAQPSRAVRLTNDTGFALEEGPVAIYSAGTFVGEGFVGRMARGATTFLTFALDGSVSFKPTASSGEEVVRLLRIGGGQILSEVLQISVSEHEITNHHELPITAVVKSRSPGSAYKLRSTAKDLVSTPSSAYVPIEVPAGKTRTLKIEWVTPVKRWLAVDTSMAQTVLKLFASSGSVPDAIKPVLEQILGAQQRLSQIEQQLGRIERLKHELAADQDRVRENLDLLRKVKGNAELQGKLTRSLAELETKLSGLTAELVKLDEEKARLRGTLEALIGQIKLDAE